MFQTKSTLMFNTTRKTYSFLIIWHHLSPAVLFVTRTIFLLSHFSLEEKIWICLETRMRRYFNTTGRQVVKPVTAKPERAENKYSKRYLQQTETRLYHYA